MIERFPLRDLSDCGSVGAGAGTLDLEPGVWRFKVRDAEAHIQKTPNGQAIGTDTDGDYEGWPIDPGDEPVDVYLVDRDTLAYYVAAGGKLFYARVQVLDELERIG